MHGSLSYNASSMNNVSTKPVFTQPFNADLSEVTSSDGELYYSSGSLYWNKMFPGGLISVNDLTGKVLLSERLMMEDGVCSLTELPEGLYVAKVQGASGETIKMIKLFH